MGRTGWNMAGALALAALVTAGEAGAQETEGSGGATAAPGAAGQGVVSPFMERHPTPEQIAANRDRTVIVHFSTYVTNSTMLSLVYTVQSYFRLGYRSFVIPMKSPGGDPDSALYAYEMLTALPVEIATVAAGPVDSAAIILFCMGDRRYAAPGSSFLFHPMRSLFTSQDMRNQEAMQRSIDATTGWIEAINEDCFGGAPGTWDLERRDFRVLVDEAREVGMVNAEGSWFDGVGTLGSISYIPPYYPPTTR